MTSNMTQFRISTAKENRPLLSATIKKDLPLYDDPQLSDLVFPKTFSYLSGNMGEKRCPVLTNEKQTVRLYIQERDPAKRESPTERFWIEEKINGIWRGMVSSENWKQILFCLSSYEE